MNRGFCGLLLISSNSIFLSINSIWTFNFCDFLNDSLSLIQWLAHSEWLVLGLIGVFRNGLERIWLDLLLLHYPLLHLPVPHPPMLHIYRLQPPPCRSLCFTDHRLHLGFCFTGDLLYGRSASPKSASPMRIRVRDLDYYMIYVHNISFLGLFSSDKNPHFCHALSLSLSLCWRRLSGGDPWQYILIRLL